jgi:hypothetical protein
MTPTEIAILFRVYQGMIWRCTRPSHNSFEYYGGRGINVCDRWLNSFDHFVADVGARPSPDHQLDRKENDGNYEPDNVKWSTRTEQCLNRRSNRILEFRGRKQAMLLWAKEFGIPRLTLKRRIDDLGWPLEKALTTPVAFDGTARPRERFITANGETKRLSEWARDLGVHPTAITSRIQQGWSPERAVTEPAAERPNAKLDLAKAQAIRAAYPAMSVRELMANYAVSKKTIHNIIHGVIYRDDPNLENSNG